MNRSILFFGGVLVTLMVACPPYEFGRYAGSPPTWVSDGQVAYAPIWAPPVAPPVASRPSVIANRVAGSSALKRIDTTRLLMQLGSVALLSLLGAWAMGSSKS